MHFNTGLMHNSQEDIFISLQQIFILSQAIMSK